LGLSSVLTVPRVIGHRGAAAVAPENSAAGFRAAKDQGASWVELDVQLSAEGVPVVFHDETLDRCSTGHGPLRDTPLAVLRGLDAGSWFSPDFAGQSILTLAEALELILSLGLGVNIEIKASEADGAKTALAAMAVASQIWPADRPPPLISSFAQSALEVVSGWPKALLQDSLSPEWPSLMERLGCVSLNANARAISPMVVAEAKRRGWTVLAYTVNDPMQANRLLGWGVDGVFSDAPGAILRALS